MPGKTSLCYVKHAVSLEMSWPALFILTLSSQIMVQIDTESCLGLIPVHFKEVPSLFVCARALAFAFACSSECSGVQAPELEDIVRLHFQVCTYCTSANS